MSSAGTSREAAFRSFLMISDWLCGRRGVLGGVDEHKERGRSIIEVGRAHPARVVFGEGDWVSVSGRAGTPSSTSARSW